MLKNPTVWLSALLFIAMGLAIFSYRQWHNPQGLVPRSEQSYWQLEIKVNFIPLRNPLQINWQLPSDNNGFDIVREFFITHGYGVEKAENIPLQPRPSTWSKRYSLNNQTVYYRAILSKEKTLEELGKDEVVRLKRELLEDYKSSSPAELLEKQLKPKDKDATPLSIELNRLLDSVQQKTVGRKNFVRTLLHTLENEETSTNALIQSDIKGLRSTIEVVWALANRSDIPTRIANGIVVGKKAERHLPVVQWLEVLDEKENRWVRVFHNKDAEEGKEHLFALWYGKAHMLNVPNGLRENYVVSIQPTTYAGIAEDSTRSSSQSPNGLINLMDLRQLPVGNQIFLKVLLVIPVGALIMAAMRQFVGIKTFGTFLPILLAISFRETGLMVGLLLLFGIILMGLIARSYLARLKLLFVPRISAAMTLVILLITILSVFFQNVRIESGLAIFLFPIVIITMLIERISLMLDEAGPQETLMVGLGTLVVTLMSYAVVSNMAIQYFFFTFPESLLVIVGLQILLGRYAGFRLTEYLRFRDLMSGPDPAKPLGG